MECEGERQRPVLGLRILRWQSCTEGEYAASAAAS